MTTHKFYAYDPAMVSDVETHDPAPTLTSIFDARTVNVTQERGEDYGHPYDDFLRASVIKAAVRDCKDDAVRHALEMIGVKMSRLVETPDHLDSIIDIAGYARTIAMICDRRNEGVKK